MGSPERWHVEQREQRPQQAWTDTVAQWLTHAREELLQLQSRRLDAAQDALTEILLALHDMSNWTTGATLSTDILQVLVRRPAATRDQLFETSEMIRDALAKLRGRMIEARAAAGEPMPVVTTDLAAVLDGACARLRAYGTLQASLRTGSAGSADVALEPALMERVVEAMVLAALGQPGPVSLEAGATKDQVEFLVTAGPTGRDAAPESAELHAFIDIVARMGRGRIGIREDAGRRMQVLSLPRLDPEPIGLFDS